MATEIERKFLVRDDSWRAQAKESTKIRQAYLANTGLSSVRIRIAGELANINIKQMRIGPSRSEYEYGIPLVDAGELLDTLCENAGIEKTRYYVERSPHTWEIDVFGGANEGLVVAEIELSDVNEHFDRPGWLGQEVTDDARYYNVALSLSPWTQWQD